VTREKVALVLDIQRRMGAMPSQRLAMRPQRQSLY